MPAVQELYRQYGATAEFLMVYIREAHPSDAWQSETNADDGIEFGSPKDFGERSALARCCTTKLEVGFPAVVDELDNATDEAYTAWPERMVVIDRDGRIRWMSAPGPFGFEPEQLAQQLDALSLESACR